MSSSLDFKYQQESCSERRHGDRQRAVGRPNTTQLLYLSLMAEPDTAVIPLKPFEESQCPTASPATCTITIKGYYRHSSISARVEQATDTTPVHFHALLLLLLSLHPHTTSLLFSPLHLSITVHVYTIWCLCTHPSTFHSLSLHFIAAQSLFLSGFNLLVDTTLPSVRPCRDHILRLIFNVVMMQLQKQAFPQSNWLLGSFHSYFCFCCRLAWLACFRAEKKQKNKWVLQVAGRRRFRVDVLTFVERQRERANPRRKQWKTSAPLWSWRINIAWRQSAAKQCGFC